MNSAEADNPDRWILQHRKEVFPPGIEDDTMLAYQALPASGGQSSLAVGLTRRSTIVQLQASIVRVGCWLDQVVLGPLHMLEASIIRATSGCDFIIDRAGVGSIGCWFFQQGAIQGWAEISVTGSERSDAQIPVESLIRVFGSRIYIEEETPRIIEAPAFVPSVKVRPKSRWLLPTIPPHRRSFASIQWTADSTPQVFERWSAWVFRWAVVLAVAVLALGLAGHSLSVAVTALRGGSAAEFATVSAKFDQLTIERNRLLSKLAQLSALGVARSASGRFWFDLGVTKPEQVWLRSVKLQAGNARQTGALWQLEGLSLDRTSPDKFATVLAHRSHLVARVTHLERVDPSKLREVPHSLNREFYRFAIEVSQ